VRQHVVLQELDGGQRLDVHLDADVEQLARDRIRDLPVGIGIGGHEGDLERDAFLGLTFEGRRRPPSPPRQAPWPRPSASYGCGPRRPTSTPSRRWGSAWGPRPPGRPTLVTMRCRSRLRQGQPDLGVTEELGVLVGAAGLHPYDALRRGPGRLTRRAGWSTRPRSGGPRRASVQGHPRGRRFLSQPADRIRSRASCSTSAVQVDVKPLPASKLLQDYVLTHKYQMALVFD